MRGVARATVGRLASALYRTGLIEPLSRATGRLRGGVFPILAYHRVNDDGDPFFPAVPTSVFERQMAHVARTSVVLTVEELVARMRTRTVPANALAITFDDGYRDNLTHAAPILARYGLRATIFLTTGVIGTTEIPWFARLAMAVKTTRRDVAATRWGVLRLTTEAQRLRGLETMMTGLLHLEDDDLRREVARLLEHLAVSGDACGKGLMLGWDEVHALRRLGFAIGAHTVTHPLLSRVSSRRARREIFDSRQAIATACGSPPTAFAYPNGGREDYTAASTALVREAGFTCAVTTRFGLNDAGTSPWELRRGGPWEHDPALFALKLALYRSLRPLNGRSETRRAPDRGAPKERHAHG